MIMRDDLCLRDGELDGKLSWIYEGLGRMGLYNYGNDVAYQKSFLLLTLVPSWDGSLTPVVHLSFHARSVR
jgi:hypothetical protein